MSKSFETQVEGIVAASSERMTAVARQSIQDVINTAQTPVAKGGRMRVDTGFLRASGKGSLNGMPVGPTRGEKKESNSYQWKDGPVFAVIGKLDIGATFYFGWTAAYARYRETYDGFLETALQRWPEIVAKNVRELEKRIRSKSGD